VLKRLAAAVEPDGYLALGAAETVVGLTDAFKPMPERRGFYVPNWLVPHSAKPLDNVLTFGQRVAAR